MHCLPCGTEMRFVRVVPYQAMLKTRELHLFECPTCRRTERRLVSAHNIGPLSGERMELATASSPLLAPAMERITALARNGSMHVGRMLYNTLASASARLGSLQQKIPVVVRNAWQRALASLGSPPKGTL
ncbi:MAG TPA: hypothetical protein VH678_33260 [Xanthobacteraceae bacterium]|jgi:hypothetical protein